MNITDEEVKEITARVIAALKDREDGSEKQSDKNELDATDYPLYKKHPEKVVTPTGKTLEDINLENVLKQKVQPQDFRITPQTLKMQGEIAKNAGRPAIQNNLQRASELTNVPDARLLEMYNALRPYRSSKQELLDIAAELNDKYQAPICSNWFKEAAENYEHAHKLKGDN
ncbi:diol dehydratase small subunit [Ligilactobacillus pobuzihii]|uniref:diol dehydratase small subunit n=1 Tax=Ligilactobacillus pobuzihii TaxID=449659 RepID=UPI0019D0C1A1|nr:diol dehydratase small subunit [Ligilactobacillus pobuzihii]MBN7273806.1 diol dehydratase small subunit [Ligilactobacillus pobuzihii]